MPNPKCRTTDVPTQSKSDRERLIGATVTKRLNPLRVYKVANMGSAAAATSAPAAAATAAACCEHQAYAFLHMQSLGLHVAAGCCWRLSMLRLHVAAATCATS